MVLRDIEMGGMNCIDLLHGRRAVLDMLINLLVP
jgi:hypothetical protein